MKENILAANYLEEQRLWRNLVRTLFGDDWNLVSVSNDSSDIRIYDSQDRIYKIRKLTKASFEGRVNSLESEYILLSNLSGLFPEIPEVFSYRMIDEFEVLCLSQLPAIPTLDPTFSGPRERLRDYLKIVRLVWRLNLKGFSHGDLTHGNIGLNERGGLSCFDFDQAVSGHPLNCILRDFLGIPMGGHGCKISLLKRLKNVVWFIGLTRIYTVVKDLMFGQRAFCDWDTLNLRCILSQDPLCTALYSGWKQAAESNANSPGMGKAYYSLDYRGIHFPGERPWAFRWEMIDGRVSFKGKRFLELGCNMSLLSIQAALGGAVKCTGVDINQTVLNAASSLAEAFSVKVDYHAIDFDSVDPWEEKLKGHDCVSALSVLHWVKDKERFLNFLAGFNEVLFEGHDDWEVEVRNFKRMGFERVEVLGRTERNRSLLYAAKTGDHQ